MTEADWVRETDAGVLLWELREGLSDRKVRLFACACCRRILHLLPPDPVWEATLEAAERFADGLATQGELEVAGRATYTQRWEWPGAAAAATIWAEMELGDVFTAWVAAAAAGGAKVTAWIPCWASACLSLRKSLQRCSKPGGSPRAVVILPPRDGSTIRACAGPGSPGLLLTRSAP